MTHLVHSLMKRSGCFCMNVVHKTSFYLSRIFGGGGGGDGDGRSPVDVRSQPPDEWVLPAAQTPPSRSESQCSCLSCSLPPVGLDRIRRSSRFLENCLVEDFYELHEVLGEGTFSTVYLAEDICQPGGLVAVKVVDKRNLRRTVKLTAAEADGAADVEVFEDLSWMVNREIEIMSALDHPHIVHLEEVFEDENRVCFILELAKGGEVFDRLIERVTFTETEAADLLVQLLCAVTFMHANGVVHRDLKLENLLYYDDTEDSKIMVADFGLSNWEWELSLEGLPICGTPGYLAPEVISRQPCSTAADVWSIGVIAYILLAGYPPFFAAPDEEDNDATLFKKILNGDYEFHDNVWRNVSSEAKHFIRALLCPDPAMRPTCDEALGHPWLNDRQNLQRRDQIRLQDAYADENWSGLQRIAFGFSLLIIVCSYLELVTYIFNLNKPLVLTQQWEAVCQAASLVWELARAHLPSDPDPPV